MLYRRGEIWWFKFQFAGRVFRESAKTKSKSLARQAERKRHQALEEGIHGIKKRQAPVTFAVAAAEWLKMKEPTLAPKSYRIESVNIDKHLKPAFGSLLLIDITADDIATYQQDRRKEKAAPKTINLEVGTLRAILKRHRLWANLQPDVKMLSVPDDVGRALTADEEQALLKACAGSRSKLIYPFAVLALSTGMRRGEILGLRWRQVDFLGARVTVGHSKTEAGRGRVVPLNDDAIRALTAWATRFPDRESDHYVFPSERYGLAANDSHAHAHSVDVTKPVGSVKEAWESARKSAGVTHRIHDLRHTACTRMLERGVPLTVVGAIVGWSAATMARMARRYGHISLEAQRIAVGKLSSEVPAEPQTDQPRERVSREGGHKKGHSEALAQSQEDAKLLK